MRRLFALAVVMAILPLSAPAATVVTKTIDFQNLENDSFTTECSDDAPIADPDYQFVEGWDPGFRDWCVIGTNNWSRYAGSTGLFLNFYSITQFSRVDGQEFTMEGIDLAFISNGILPNKSTTVTFTAIKDCSGCSPHQQEFTIFGSDPFQFYSFEFDDGFEDVLQVNWRVENDLEPVIQFDNIVVSTVVPVPAAVWLFASALFGLGWLRRSQ